MVYGFEIIEYGQTLSKELLLALRDQEAWNKVRSVIYQVLSFSVYVRGPRNSGLNLYLMYNTYCTIPLAPDPFLRGTIVPLNFRGRKSSDACQSRPLGMETLQFGP